MEVGALHLTTLFWSPKALRKTSSSSQSLNNIKDSPPPHHRLRSFIISSASIPNISSTSPYVVDNNTTNPSITHPYLPPPHQEQQNNNFSSSVDDVSGGDYNSSHGVSANHGASTFGNLDYWKGRLITFLHGKDKQELVSREKKDRRDYEQIAALASKMGLHSHLYAKVVVISKVPLPDYRFDLDDKRPQREVTLPLGLQRKVDAHLVKYLSQKTRSMDSSQDNVFSTTISNNSIGTNDGFFEQQDLFSQHKRALEKVLWRRSMQLHMEQQAWQKSSEGEKMLEFRRSLPAYKVKDTILNSISRNQVVIISGETGCGKTTQIPQFILESEIDSDSGAKCSIICTQPRRISAISVSERIATERGEKLGETVGYKVRLEGMKGRDTHLLFYTTGILLRRLLIDRNLEGVTHVIMDEIHERGVNEDFLLTVLKELLPRRPELRLVLMSATLKGELFSSYFDGAPVVHIPEALGYADFSEYSQQTRDSLLCWNPDSIGFNLIEYLLSNICENEKTGAVLVFMTGWDDISSLMEKLQAHPVLGDPSRVLLLACHGSMPSSEQRLIFEKPDSGVRKIVLATNIAETSITIDDVVFVIDCGKAKEASYDALSNTPCLLPSWISKVSAIQRRGRAGRVQPGECHHLYPKCVYDAFADYQLPQILRTPLQSLCLQIRSLSLGSISGFLSRALQSPASLANAIEYLKIIGALDDLENLTVLGRYLTMLPVEPKLGKMLVLGVALNCLDPILTIVAGLSVRDPFLSPLDKKELAEAAKAQFSDDFSDHLAIVRAYKGWKVAEQKLSGYEYCWENFLSPQSMIAIDSIRGEFQSLLRDIGLIGDKTAIHNAWSYDENLVRAVICYGLYPGVCSIVHKETSLSLKTMEDGQVFLHSNSVNARDSKIPYPWLVFNEKIKVHSVYLRESTAVSDSMLLLFGGSISLGDVEGHIKMLGGYLEFFMEPAVAEMYRTLKQELEELFHRKLMNPRMDLHAHHELLSAIQLLLSGDRCSGRFVFNHQAVRSNLIPSIASAAAPSLPLVPRTECGPGGNNPKSQLQTLLTRAGHGNPIYKTDQLSNNQFRAICEFNGMQIMGRPCNNKKQAEKDAAAEALGWLLGGIQGGHEFIDSMSMMMKKSKNHK